jgi:hypothetical protein
MGARDATGFESGEVPLVVASPGSTPLPEEEEPTLDDTRGRRPEGTPEMGHAPRLKR